MLFGRIVFTAEIPEQEITKAFQLMDGFFKWGSDVMATWNRK